MNLMATRSIIFLFSSFPFFIYLVPISRRITPIIKTKLADQKSMLDTILNSSTPLLEMKRGGNFCPVIFQKSLSSFIPFSTISFVSLAITSSSSVGTTITVTFESGVEIISSFPLKSFFSLSIFIPKKPK